MAPGHSYLIEQARFLSLLLSHTRCTGPPYFRDPVLFHTLSWNVFLDSEFICYYTQFTRLTFSETHMFVLAVSNDRLAI